MKSRRSAAAHSVTRKRVLEEDFSRKAYTGDNPITGDEWRRERETCGYTQAVFGYYMGTHPNTVAKRERDEQVFSHPRLARLAIEQLKLDIKTGQVFYNNSPITGAEWQTYMGGLEMDADMFGIAIDAHPITVSRWIEESVPFQHPTMARLAMRKLYALHHQPFPIFRPRGAQSRT